MDPQHLLREAKQRRVKIGDNVAKQLIELIKEYGRKSQKVAEMIRERVAPNFVHGLQEILEEMFPDPTEKIEVLGSEYQPTITALEAIIKHLDDEIFMERTDALIFLWDYINKKQLSILYNYSKEQEQQKSVLQYLQQQLQLLYQTITHIKPQEQLQYLANSFEIMGLQKPTQTINKKETHSQQPKKQTIQTQKKQQNTQQPPTTQQNQHENQNKQQPKSKIQSTKQQVTKQSEKIQKTDNQKKTEKTQQKQQNNKKQEKKNENENENEQKQQTKKQSNETEKIVNKNQVKEKDNKETQKRTQRTQRIQRTQKEDVPPLDEQPAASLDQQFQRKDRWQKKQEPQVKFVKKDQNIEQKFAMGARVQPTFQYDNQPTTQSNTSNNNNNNNNQITIIVVVVSQSKIQDIKPFIKMGPSQYMPLDEVRLKDMKVNQFERFFYYYFNLKVVAQLTNFPLQLRWQQMRQASTNTNYFNPNVFKVTECRPWNNKQLIITSAGQGLHNYQQNRALYLAICSLFEKTVKNNEKTTSAITQQQKRPTTQIFDWLYLFSQKIGRISERDIPATLADLPHQNEHCTKLFFFFLYYQFGEGTLELLQRIRPQIQFPFQYKKPQEYLSRYHQVLEQAYLRVSYQYMISQLNYQSNNDHGQQHHSTNYWNIAGNFLAANLEAQNNQIVRRIIITTAYEFPPLLMSDIYISEFLKNCEFINPIEYYNLNTHFLRLRHVSNIYQNTNLTENCHLVLGFLEGLLKKFIDFQKHKKSDKIHEVHVDENKYGINEIFIIKDGNSKQGEKRFVLYGQFFVRADIIFKKISKYHAELPKKILDKTLHYYTKALQECFKQNIADILPFYLEKPLGNKEKNIIHETFQDKNLLIGLKEIRQILFKCFPKKDSQEQSLYDLPLLIEKLNLVIKRDFNGAELAEIFNETLKNITNNTQRNILLKLIEEGVKAISFKKWMHDEQLLKVSKYQENIKQMILSGFCQSIQKELTKIQRDNLVSRLQNTNIEEEELDYIIQLLYQGQNVKFEEQQMQVMNAMIKTPKLIKAYFQKYRKTNFKEVIAKIYSKIEEKEIYERDFQQIFKNREEIHNILISLKFNFKTKIQQIKKEKDDHLNKIDNLQRIFQIHAEYADFNEHLNFLTEAKKKVHQQKIRNSLVIQPNYQLPLNFSKQMLILINLQIWPKKKVVDLQSLLRSREQTIQKISQSIDRFGRKQLMFSEFVKMFPKEYLQDILKYGQNKQYSQEIHSVSQRLDLKWLQQFQRYATSLDYLTKRIQNRFNQQFVDFYKMMNELKQKKWEINTHEVLRLINVVNQLFIKLGITVCSDRDEIGRVVLRTGESDQMFKFIEEKELDDKTINDLKQYINDLENSILRLQTVKQFENVVVYWSFVQQATKVNQLLIKLKKQIVDRNWILSECITNSFITLKLIEQKIDQSANRQTSFKYEVENIFHNSTFVMEANAQNNIEIKIVVKEQIKVLESKRSKREDEVEDSLLERKNSKKNNWKLTTIDYKKIVNYKEKSLLLISDFEREKSNIDQKTLNIINVLKLYFSLYKTIDEIVKGCEILIKYGYDPKSLQREVVIAEQKYQTVQQIAEFIKQQAEEWMKEVKKVYEQSYLLTHFLGPQLNNFINLTLNKTYHPSLKWIIKLDEKQFAEMFNTLTVRNLLKKFHAHKNERPVQRIRLIDQIFKDYRCPQKIQKKQQAKISLVSCRRDEFYCCLFDNIDDKPEINQILYCESETKPEQIQVFFNRTKLRPSKKHYIVAIHNLNTELQLYVCDLLNKDFISGHQQNNTKIVFVDCSLNEKVYLHLCRPNLFNIQKLALGDVEIKRRAKAIAQNCGQTHLIESVRAGLGKTFQAEKLAKGRKIRYFPLAGNIDFTMLSQRLKDLKLQQGQSILLQIGHIENKKKLEIFLYQVIMFKCFYYRGYYYLPKDLQIMVEMENIQEVTKEDEYHILKFLREFGTRNVFVQKFEVEELVFNPQSQKQKFILNYLQLIDNQFIAKREVRVTDNLRMPNSPERLISKFLCEKLVGEQSQLTYALYKRFMDMLFVAFKTFSQSGYFSPHVLRQSNMAFPFLELQKVRLRFLNICIENSLQFLKETVTTNQFDTNMNKEDFREKLTKFPFLIMPSSDFHSYKFVYMQSEQLPMCIKAFLLSQQFKFHRELSRLKDQKKIAQLYNKQFSMSNMKGGKLQEEFYNILYGLSGNRKLQGKVSQMKERIPALSRYSLTLDNFFKMCLIIQRSICRIPIVIMGESGVGKTALITFLVKTVLEEDLICLNIHAGVNEAQIVVWVQEIIAKAREIQDADEKHRQEKISEMEEDIKNRREQGEKVSSEAPGLSVERRGRKLWVFFDEFNTTDELSYVKEMVMDRRFRGQPLPENIVMMAACNPFRRKQVKNTVKAGIKKESAHDDNLAFRVIPPNLSMIQLMWDYQQLRQKEIGSYVGKILEDIGYKEHEKLVEAISWTHEFFKDNVELSSVSLRDVSRFKELYFWFEEFMPRKPVDRGLALLKHDNKKDHNYNYNMKRQDRALILAFSFCYSLRLASTPERHLYLKNIEKILTFEEDLMKRVTKNEQIDYVNRLKSPGAKIALNFALRENVFTTLVCLMNKIPVLIIGNPGSSKSLSIKMIASNFRGVNSTSEFCKKFPEINMIYFQGSESCTSKGIEAVFEKATRSKEEFEKKNKEKQFKLENCILFDEIGLAEKSVHNPLKVLHSKLETNVKDIGFIGISNWELDAAKMSRFLILARSSPDLSQLEETSVQIYESYFPNSNTMNTEFFRKLAKHYHEFLIEWNKNTENREGFFGLRDFYCYVKYVCESMLKNGSDGQIMKEALRKSIQINFDGQPGSLLLFNKIAQIDSHIVPLSPLEIVQENLISKESRVLLLIVKGDALIPIINESISRKDSTKRVVCIYGSTFKSDQESQQYNLEMTSIIISHISRGNTLTFKDINNSIQTSLYDLFNKSFYEVGEKKYCRIAVGANSNPKCYVHHLFNAIVYIDESKIMETDLAFLNRFQKHYLNLKSMINIEEEEIIVEINKWLDQILSFRDPDSPMKPQNYIINSCIESIVTLIIKYRDQCQNDRKKIVRKIKQALLQNRTLDFEIALKSSETHVSEQLKKQIDHIISNEIVPYKKETKDLIIYTYDQYLDMSDKHIQQKIYQIRISEIKCERDLRKQLDKFFDSPKEQYQVVHVHINYQNQLQHINLILYTASSLKEQYESQKQLVIVIQLHRFSLIALKMDYINISYLHKFQQYFSQDLTIEGQTKQLLQISNYNELFKKLQFEEIIHNLVLQTLKRFKFNTEHIKQQQVNHPLIIQSYFLQCARISHNQLFKEKCLYFVERHLKKQIIDYHSILQNKQDILTCSNVKQAIIKSLEEKVIQLLCHFMFRIITNNFVFNFNPMSLLQYYGNMENVSILKQFIVGQQKIYKQIFHRFLEDYVVAKDKDRTKKFSKGVQSNIIDINFPTCFPLMLKEFNYIFLKNQSAEMNSERVENYTNKLLEYSLSHQKKDDTLFQINYHKAITLFGQKTKLNSSKNEQSQQNRYQYWTYLNKIGQNNLFIGYLFDVLHYICTETQIENKYLCKLLDMMIWLFEDLNLENKIILLTMDRNFWARILQIIMVLFKYEDHIIIEEFIEDQLKNDIEFNRVKSDDSTVGTEQMLSKLIIKLGSKIMLLVGNFLRLNVETVQRYEIQKYIKFFKEISVPVRKMLTSYEEYGLSIDQNFLVTIKLIELFEKINKGDVAKLIQEFVVESNESGCYPKRIYHYVQILIQRYSEQINPTVNRVQILLNYLAFNIFCSWLSIANYYSNESPQTLQVILNFINFSNNYAYFANNSVFFFQQLFEQFVSASGYDNKLKAINAMPKEIVNLLNTHLTMQNNFSVALGNFFSDKLKIDIDVQQEGQQMITQQNNNILKRYLPQFQQEVRKQITSPLQQVIRLQFCKIYMLQYFVSLLGDLNLQILPIIDRQLCQETSIAKHLRIYLLKYIYGKYRDIVVIRKEFLENGKCEWVKCCSDLIQESKVEQCIVPPSIKLTAQKSPIRTTIEEFRQSKYINTSLFHNILKTALTSPQDMYECLNFMIIDFYTRTVPKNMSGLYLKQFQERQEFKDKSMVLERTLISRYIEGYINQQYQFKDNTKMQDFIQNQLANLNILNIIVSLRKNDTPFMEMFFDKEGRIPIKFADFINDRFLIGGRQNGNVTLLQTLIERNDNTPGYYKCSASCNYYYSVGGGSLGCQNVIHVAECPYCGGEIGGVQHGVLKRQNEGARKVTLQELVPACNQIRQQKFMTVKGAEYRLIGYTSGNTIEQIKKTDVDSTRINIVTRRILNNVVMTIWYFLVELGLIRCEQFNRIFQLKTDQQSLNLLSGSVEYYHTKLNETLELRDKTDLIIWEMGIAKSLFHAFMRYKKSVKANELGSLSLTACLHRDKCEKILSNEIVRYTGGKEKEELLLKSRSLREGFTLTKQDFIKEIGDIKVHCIEYPSVRMYKLIQTEKWPSFRNLIREYGSVIGVEHPVLEYLINHEDSFKKMVHFKNVYSFVTRVLKNAHFRITREYAKTTSLEAFCKEYLQQESSSTSDTRKEMESFCRSWNYLLYSKYELRLGCQDSLGEMPRVSPEDQLRVFLPDNKHTDNREGKKILALLLITAGEYNQLCQGLEESINKLREFNHNQNIISIFSSTMLNPTQVNNHSRMVDFPCKEIEDYVKSYSSFSVEYGISVPHYALDEIQSLVIKYYYSCKYLVEQYQQYNTVNFVGELIHCISDIRSNSEQVSLQSLNLKQIVNDFVYRMYIYNKDVFFKTIRNIQGSLENIMIYYKNVKKGSKVNIREFVSENKIKGLCSQIFEEPFDTIPLCCIVSLYEVVESSTFDQIPNLLDPAYCRDQLTQQQKRLIEAILNKMRNSPPELPTYQEFRTALYRFASRSLLLMERDAKLILIDFLANGEELWPIGKEIEEFAYNPDLREAFSIPLTKAGKLMQLVPPPKMSEQVSKKKVVEQEKQAQFIGNNQKSRKQQQFHFDKEVIINRRNPNKNIKKHF